MVALLSSLFQFGYQEPATAEEIPNVLRYVRPGNGFQPTFDIFNKVDVNGANEDKIFTMLKVHVKFLFRNKNSVEFY